ncbi:MAG: hypothetical protein IPK83_20885 [Planctomycetes bacterium]|nr:hypothetical protein [Planctomycetota bacterium]
MSNLIACAVVLYSAATGAIPEPSVLIWGNLQLNGQPVTANDDVRVFARVPEAPDDIGSYQMGSNLSAGDLFAIQIRLESLADGTAQSTNRALVGQTAQIFIDGGDVPNGPILVANFRICEKGQIRQASLPGIIPGTAGDFDQDCDVDFDDIAPFVNVLLGVDQSPSNIAAADMDLTGTADGHDIQLFVDAILAGA